MAVKVIKKFDLSKINLDFSRELNESSRIIRKDHITRLEGGRGVDDSRMENLKPSTIARKGFDQILVDTGAMRKLVTSKATKKKQIVEIHPGKKRDRNGVTSQEIGYYHQTGSGHLPEREWFGISKDAEKRSMKLMELRIDRELKRA